MPRSPLRLLPLCTVALALAAGCNDTTAGTSTGSTGSSATNGTGGSTTGGSATTGAGSTTGGGSTTSGGSTTGGTTAAVDAGCGPSHFHCPPAQPICDLSDGGACVQCQGNSDCHGAKPICIVDDGTPLAGFYVNKCAQCQTSADCVSTGNTRGPICDTSGQAVVQMTEYTCGPNCLDGGSCDDPARPICNVTGLCVGCESNSDCTDPIKTQCDRVNGSCIQCFNDGDCNGAVGPEGPQPYCYENQSGLPSSLGQTCVGCVDAGNCDPNGFETKNACNSFSNYCERSCALFLDCADPFIGVCTQFSDATSDPLCGCDPNKASPANGCSGTANSCLGIFMGPPAVGACSCINGAGTNICPNGQVCDVWATPLGACTPPCTGNSDCTNSHRPVCDTSTGMLTSGACLECLADSDCTAGYTCDLGTNVCRASCASGSCPATQPLCNGQTGLCQECQNPFGPPVVPSGCPKDKICSFFFNVSPNECQ